MIEEELVNLIANVGFPIAITLYLLISRDKVIKENTAALKELIFVVRTYKK